MAKKDASAGNATTPKKGKKKFYGFLFLLTCIGLIVGMRIGFVFLLLGLLPSVVAYYVDTSPQRGLYKTVACCNLAGILPFIPSMIIPLSGQGALQMVVTQPRVWLIIYASAGAGWILLWMCKTVAMLFTDNLANSKIAVYERAQKHLLEEWGQQIKRRDAQ